MGAACHSNLKAEERGLAGISSFCFLNGQIRSLRSTYMLALNKFIYIYLSTFNLLFQLFLLLLQQWGGGCFCVTAAAPPQQLPADLFYDYK